MSSKPVVGIRSEVEIQIHDGLRFIYTHLYDSQGWFATRVKVEDAS